MNIDSKQEKALVLFGLFSLALAVRLAGQGGQCLSAEEIHFLGGWRCGLGCFFDLMSRADQPPLAFLFYKFWGLFSRSTAWMRLAPALFSAGTVVFAYLLIELKITRTTAILSAIFLALSPASIVVGHEVSALPIAAFFITASAYYAALWLGTHGERFKAATVVFAVLALYTHYFAWFYIVFLLFALLSTAIHPGFKRSFAYTPVLAVLASAVPWLPMLYRQAVHVEAISERADAIQFLADSMHYAFFGMINPDGILMNLVIRYWPKFGAEPAFVLFIILVALSVVLLWGAFRHPFLGVLFIGSLIGGVLANIPAPVFKPQDLCVFLPAGFACIAAGIGELSKFRLPGRLVAGGAAVLVLGVGVIFFTLFLADTANLTRSIDWRLYRLYLPRGPESDFIVTYSAQDSAAVQYYLPRDAHFVPLAQTDWEALRLGPRGLADEAKLIAAQGRGILFVGSDSNRFDPERLVPKTIAASLGDQVLSIPLHGTPRTYLKIYPKQSPALKDLDGLYWLFKWPAPWRTRLF